MAGADSWGRIGVDLNVLGVYTLATNTIEADIRLVPTLRVKGFDNSYLTAAIGPRWLTGRDTGPDLIATVGFTYDVDALLDSARAAGANSKP